MHQYGIDAAYPLYDARWEHDACGTGFLAQISGEPSHALIQTALQALTNLTHRGAQDADAETSDGAGLLTQIPRALLSEELQAQGITLSDPDDFAVGMIFLPSQERSPDAYAQSRQIIEQTLNELNLPVLIWRNPPIDTAVLGARARATAPSIAQLLLARPQHLDLKQYERELYFARRQIERRLYASNINDCYIVSLSCSTVIYKGLLAPQELARFYLDLADPSYASALAVFHQRYSTNTFPSWPLAQPMRLLAHNGEINTLLGNRNWMQAREGTLSSELWGDRLQALLPIIQQNSSDSGQLDNVLELLALSGRDLLQSMHMLIPPAWEQNPELDPAQRAECEYHAGMIEPWDGPAALVFSDGRIVGAALDRNGLRPARYTLTSHGLLILASEAGVVPCEPHEVVEKGRLGPGEIIAVDLKYGILLRDSEIKASLAQRQPYQQWLETHLVRLSDHVLVGADLSRPAPIDRPFDQQQVPTDTSSNNGSAIHRTPIDADTLFQRQQLFGYTHEDIEFVLRAILTENKEPVWSMGDDTPLAALSSQARSFSDYFHQRFAQVTNPPIDSLREKIVMSLDCYLGHRQSLLTETPLHAQLLHLETPLLDECQLETLRNLKAFPSRTLNTTFGTDSIDRTLVSVEADLSCPPPIYRPFVPSSLESALDRLESEAVSAVHDGISLLILSDQDASPTQPPIPMLIGIGAVHQALVRRGMRTQLSLICETNSTWDVHQIALLFGFGAEAICPSLALTSVRALAGERHLEHITEEQAVKCYMHVIEDGLRKIMARMGISTLRNIIGAGQFEVMGLAPDLIERCFAGSPAHPGKITLAHIADQVIQRCQPLQQTQTSLASVGVDVPASTLVGVSAERSGAQILRSAQDDTSQEAVILSEAQILRSAQDDTSQEAVILSEAQDLSSRPSPIDRPNTDAPSPPTQTRRRKLTDIGRYRFRRDGEYHAYHPQLVRALQKAAQTGDMEDYRRFTELVYSRPPTALRDLLTFAPTTPIPLEQVEPMESIRARFVVSAMSVGALSPETHRTIAAAMNSIGGRNNTGEGGEDPNWYHETLNGYPVSSKIKQVASARFGVTPEYLVRAEELEIKMAQGSKPGEGGQLPAKKVTPFIARLRHTAPGVQLISPPPHHDIYSIEDIAQLIYDLKQINPKARIGVKLVSCTGVGTIAAGVAKAHADYVLISGHDGGTGASPLQSIKHAGIPWERGLAETQQILLRNGLRGRVKVRVDGGLKTGRDVVIGAMLGAEEFGFGTASLISLGCDMARQCHLNTCPTGIATQREDLRAKFAGTPQLLIHYLTLVAEEVREWLAQLGVRRLDDLIGRADLLQSTDEVNINLETLLVSVPGTSSPPFHPIATSSHRVGTETTSHPVGADLSRPAPIDRPSAPPTSSLAQQLLIEAEPALRGEKSVLTQHSIRNDDRTIGASLAGEIARRHGNAGLPGVSITSIFQGSAGQSFGAFCMPGMYMVLHGEANDYVGKSMRGGQIIIAPPIKASFAAHKNTILGNTVLYGATGGLLFASGCAGERFAVRNSGALAVVEGVGAHACEYMTGGLVVILGETGRNFGAGMTAGAAYVLDTDGTFPAHCNNELVELQRISDPDEIEALRTIIQWHHKKTRSWRASQLLAEWSRMHRIFWRVSPRGTGDQEQAPTSTARDYVDAHTHNIELIGAAHL